MHVCASAYMCTYAPMHTCIQVNSSVYEPIPLSWFRPTWLSSHLLLKKKLSLNELVICSVIRGIHVSTRCHINYWFIIMFNSMHACIYLWLRLNIYICTRRSEYVNLQIMYCHVQIQYIIISYNITAVQDRIRIMPVVFISINFGLQINLQTSRNVRIYQGWASQVFSTW